MAKELKVALVHDYIREYGGAERVLRELADMYPSAPIYTSFRIKNSTADKAFSDRKIVESFLSPLLKVWRFYSVFRILTPLVWRSIDLRGYDLVITSASWYITRGMRVSKNTKVICYCHTPPRWLYGYETSGDWQGYLPVKVVAAINRFFLRIYDNWSVGTVDHWIANSKNVAGRIKRLYGSNSVVIYPPIEVDKIIKATNDVKKGDYFFIASRLTGNKGLAEAVSAANKYKFKLKVAGEAADVSRQNKFLKATKGETVELLGRVSDEELYKLYAGAKAFLALSKDEDFGMTLAESISAGTPVIALNSGGYKETVVDGVTGLFIESTDTKTIGKAVRKMEKINWNRATLQEHAKRFNKLRFRKEIRDLVSLVIGQNAHKEN